MSWTEVPPLSTSFASQLPELSQVAIVAGLIDNYRSALRAAELPAVERAVEKRVQEFATGRRLARIDILSEAQRRSLKSVMVTEDQVPPGGGFHEVAFPVRLPWATKLRIRIRSFGDVHFWVDRLRVARGEYGSR